MSKAKCLNPNTAWYCGVIRSKQDGVWSPRLVFSPGEVMRYANRIGVPPDRYMDANAVAVPCGKCMACRIRKRRDQATRLVHESSVHGDDCCFVTLTYNDDNVPVTDKSTLDSDFKVVDRGVGKLPLQTLLVSDVQRFVKRLRRHLEYVPKSASRRVGRDHLTTPIRYFVVGEYGSKYRRPHYHLMIFGWRPSDMTFWERLHGHAIYRSAQVEKLWTHGFSTVAPVTGAVARYCARYVTKKYARLANDSDPYKDCVWPEFTLQSIKHGAIGAPWFDRNYQVIMDSGYCQIALGTQAGYYKVPIPTYYMRRARKYHLCRWLQLRDERMYLASSAPPMSDDAYEDLVRSCNVFAHRERDAQQRELF